MPDFRPFCTTKTRYKSRGSLVASRQAGLTAETLSPSKRADWNLTGTDGCARLWARYDFRTDDGAIVGVINEAVHPLSPPDGPAADPSSVAIITRPVFEASAGAPSWLNAVTFAGILRIASPVQVNIEVFRLAVQS